MLRAHRSLGTAAEEEQYTADARAFRDTYNPSQHHPQAAAIDFFRRRHLLSPLGEFSAPPSPPRHGCAAHLWSPELRLV